MTDAERIAEIDTFCEGKLQATGTDLRRWLQTDDLEVLSRIVETVVPKWELIEGASRGDYSSLLDQLLIASLGRPEGSETAFTFIDVARIYLGWLRQLVDESSGAAGAQSLQAVVDRLGELYTAMPDARPRILNGIVEHAFELQTLRPLFEKWSREPVLADAYNAAAEWADTQ